MVKLRSKWLINSKGKEIGQTSPKVRPEKSKTGTASRTKPFKRYLHETEVQSHLDFWSVCHVLNKEEQHMKKEWKREKLKWSSRCVQNWKKLQKSDHRKDDGFDDGWWMMPEFLAREVLFSLRPIFHGLSRADGLWGLLKETFPFTNISIYIIYIYYLLFYIIFRGMFSYSSRKLWSHC